MKRSIKETNKLIEENISDLPYPMGIEQRLSQKQKDVISTVGHKFKNDLIMLNTKMDLEFKEIESYYMAIMDELFGEKILEIANRAHQTASGGERDQIETFMDNMNARMENAKKKDLANNAKGLIDSLKKGKVNKVGR